MEAAPAVRELPRILVFSEDAISVRHGTGAIFARLFARYPRERLTNAFIGDGRSPWIERTIDLETVRWTRAPFVQLRSWPAKIVNRVSSSRKFTLPLDRTAIAAAFAGQPAPDLIYGISFSAQGLAMLDVIASLYPRAPLTLHLHDLWPSESADLGRLLTRVVAHAEEVWAVSEPLADFVARHTGRRATVDPMLYGEIPAEWKRHHAPAGPEFRAVLFGNIWNHAALADLKSLWRHAQAAVPGLAPIQWHCHPDSLATHRAEGRTPEPELVAAGFLQGEAITRTLLDADLALVPFSHGMRAETDYERYSMPSRLTELMAHGVPVFGLASADTPLGAYIERHGVGEIGPGGAVEATGRSLVDFIRDQARRAACGRAGRALAERDLDLPRFQEKLHTRLAALAG